MAPRVGILGLGRIGLIHARHFRDLGGDVVAVLSSSQLSAKDAVHKLNQDLGIQAYGCYDPKTFFSMNLDAVSICTPPSLHFDQIKLCFDNNVSVFCEKPLFWYDSINADIISEQIRSIRDHPNRRLFVNTSNTVFLDTLTNNGQGAERYQYFSFEFHTTGLHTGIGIAEDLMPHGLSLLIHLFGECVLSNFISQVSDHTFQCKFRYGECDVSFDFRENPVGLKHMRIGLNDNFYTRIQVGDKSTYSVYLENDKTKKIVPVTDPFKCYIGNFLSFVCANGIKARDGFFVSALNLKLMTQCLLKRGEE